MFVLFLIELVRFWHISALPETRPLAKFMTHLSHQSFTVSVFVRSPEKTESPQDLVGDAKCYSHGVANWGVWAK